MGWRQRAGALMAVAGLAVPCGSQAQTLYAASVRSLATAGGQGVAGSLYTVNLGTGSPTFVAPIRLGGSTPIGLTGLAAHPQTGVFYGITSALSTTQGQSLVTLDVNTGTATLVGELRHAASDISFNRAGILFTWLTSTSQLGIVSLTTGAVTPIGTPRAAGPPAGLAIDGKGTAFITPTGAAGTLDTVDIATGIITTGPALNEAPFPSAINSMTFTPSGLLLAEFQRGRAGQYPPGDDQPRHGQGFEHRQPARRHRRARVHPGAAALGALQRQRADVGTAGARRHRPHPGPHRLGRGAPPARLGKR
jgi:hypothetical protein